MSSIHSKSHATRQCSHLYCRQNQATLGVSNTEWFFLWVAFLFNIFSKHEQWVSLFIRYFKSNRIESNWLQTYHHFFWERKTKETSTVNTGSKTNKTYSAVILQLYSCCCSELNVCLKKKLMFRTFFDFLLWVCSVVCILIDTCHLLGEHRICIHHRIWCHSNAAALST